MISFEGSKIKLRPICPQDIEQSLKWRNDPELRESVLWFRFPVTQKMEENWYEKNLAGNSTEKVVFSIVALDSDAHIGFIHIDRIDWISRAAYLGIVIGEKDYQGKGAGSEAMEIFFNYVFGCLNFRKICLEVASYNERAIRAYEKFGFRQEGCLRKQVFWENDYHDFLIMGLLKEEFYSR
jgi:RimJ/RimL family protein N-acetyltransferase